MTITYHIKTARRTVKFTEATALDSYLKKNKFSPKAIIILKNENDNEIGTILVSEYLNFAKNNK